MSLEWYFTDRLITLSQTDNVTRAKWMCLRQDRGVLNEEKRSSAAPRVSALVNAAEKLMFQPWRKTSAEQI